MVRATNPFPTPLHTLRWFRIPPVPHFKQTKEQIHSGMPSLPTYLETAQRVPAHIGARYSGET